MEKLKSEERYLFKCLGCGKKVNGDYEVAYYCKDCGKGQLFKETREKYLNWDWQ